MPEYLKSDVFLFAGEASGDLHGAKLLKALKDHLPDLQATGVPGKEMRRIGMQSIIDMEEFQVMGFTDVALSLPKLIKSFKKICNHILEANPCAAILIDYPGFNLRLAKALRKKGYQGKIIHYISPSVWAWQPKRARILEKYVDLLLTIYPFEKEWYNHTKLNVAYVGNPLKEYILKHKYNEDWKKILKIPQAQKIIALFPGSRPSEIHKNFPLQLKAAELLSRDKDDLLFAVSCSSLEQKELLLSMVQKSALKHGQNLFIVPKEFSYELMRDAFAAVAKSGTVTLELALHACPTIVTYELSWLNQAIAKHVLRINLPNYCIVNILAKERLFPELIGHAIQPYKVYEELLHITSNEDHHKRIIAKCQQLSHSLEDGNTSERAAKLIIQEMSYA